MIDNNPLPDVLKPMGYDLALRFLFLFLFMILASFMTYFLLACCLGSVLSVSLEILLARYRSYRTREIDLVQYDYFYKELMTRDSMVSYVLMLLLGYLAFTHLAFIQVPLLLVAVLIASLSLGKSATLSFEKACRKLGVGYRRAFKLEIQRFRICLGMSLAVWEAVFFFLALCAIVPWTMRLVTPYLSRSAAIEALRFTSPLGNLLQGSVLEVESSLSSMLSGYLLYVVFLFAAFGTLYAYVLPAYLIIRPTRKFIRNMLLGILVFAASLISQYVLSYFAPTSSNALMTTLISLVIVAVAMFMQKSYEEAVSQIPS